MSLSAVVLQVLTGLASASALFLVASGLSLIFGVTRVVNFAHGSFYMVGLYAAVSLSQAFAGITPDASVLAFDRRQRGTFNKTFEDYVATRVSASRIRRGQQMNVTRVCFGTAQKHHHE